jgi:uncharacterized repeat protein (TIGR03803 family)
MKRPDTPCPGSRSAPRRLLLICAALPLVLAGCGGGGGTADATPAASPPVILSQPVATTATVGGSVTFSISASGSGLSYQWQLSIDGGRTWSVIVGATNASYLIALIHAYMNGWQYQAVVTGPGGPTTSAPVTLTLSSAGTAALAMFGTTPDGQSPTGTPVLASDGNLYGTTLSGGSSGQGTVFKVTPAGVKTVLHSFGGAGDGSGALAGLTQAPDGSLYGTTSNGGSSNNGTVYRVSTTGQVTVLYSFVGSPDGGVPYGGVTVGSDGSLYGTTNFGGSNTVGTVFRIAPSGGFSVLHVFGGAGDGQKPKSEPVVAADGSLVGVTTLGGANGNGTVYRISPAGAYSVLYSFRGGADGQGPVGRLVQAGDGNFYGTTYNGGANGSGTVFRITPAGVETVLHSFGGTGDGALPYAGLIVGLDGKLYGTTNGGGANAKGTVFSMALDGTTTVLHSFGGAADGQNPLAGLVQAANGALYGLCSAGGSANAGTVFEATP